MSYRNFVRLVEGYYMSFIEGIISGLIVEAATLMGRRLRVAIRSTGNARKADLEVVRWFDTYKMVNSGPEITVDETFTQQLAQALRSSTVHAIIHELLAARLTDAPENEVERLEVALHDALSAEGCGEISESVFASFDHHICTLVGQLSTDKSGALAQLRQEAFLGRLNATLSAIERHAAVLARRHDPEAARQFIARYRRQVREHHGKLEPPDFQRRRRVPLERLYVPPKIVFTEPNPGESSGIDVQALDELIDRVVLLGDPGGGKTTCTQFLMHRHASDELSLVPLLVTLRDFAADDPPARSVVGFLEHRLETFYQCRPPEDLVERLLLDGAALVVFDGLDELVDTTRRAEIASIVELFCSEFPLTRVLVTSRVVGYEQARLDPKQFTTYKVAGFDEGRVKDYVLRWFGEEDNTTPERAAELAKVFMIESASVPDLRANPLMLALMCILYRGEGSIPQNRPEVYEECAKLLFTKWDERRKIHMELQAKHLIEPALRHLAYWLLTRDEARATVSKRQLIDETTQFLGSHRFEDPDQALAAADQFVEFCRGRGWVFSDAGTTAHGEELYTFTHRTFMEYFAAAHLAADCDTPADLAKRLAPRVARQEWDVPGQLAVQIKNKNTNRGGERVIEALLNERRYRAAEGRGNVLGFLARCLSFIDPPPRLVRALTDRILDHALRDTYSTDLTTPLQWLLTSADSTRVDVSTQIESWLSAILKTTDENKRINGLRLIFAIEILGEGRHLQDYWREQKSALCVQHRSTLISYAHIPEIAVGTWHEEQISAEAVLAAHDNRLDFLFQMPNIGIRNVRWISIAWSCLQTVLKDENVTENVRVCEALNIIQRRISDPSEIPRFDFTLPVSSLSLLLNERLEPASYILPAELYGPAAFIVAITVELSDKREDIPPSLLGPLSDFSPYLVRRVANGHTGELPPLPIDMHLQELLASWARREIDLTGAG
ncbi:NACHT domain-containing protein [Spongiactinospora sp. TRM90649]|uniref:NACHT domain-containing protein n=1 Tax=Spongiactinospora sp. TRM90649 TaxID=3031114 RepID=UPI0023F97429|nr:NACHT domain-containing protein [Spongiactinospora sp. TRM90649]MDF5753039.1 NACHT domain-containing protein [Spongiactinospora sp. TRM90649]